MRVRLPMRILALLARPDFQIRDQAGHRNVVWIRKGGCRHDCCGAEGSGTSIGDATFFGRLAGRTAAARRPAASPDSA
jgi:hypothetical protein